MKVKRESFGFPVNRTFRLKYGETFTLLSTEDCNVKYIIECTEEQKKLINEDEIRTLLTTAYPCIKSLRFEYEVQKETHVRSEKIVKLQSLQDKLQEYFKLNEFKVEDTIYKKASDIKEALNIDHFKPKHKFQLLKVYIKGSTGINEGTGKEELEVDFSAYPEGIIALCGANGKGKTTLIENCHPYTRMLTRDGKLQDHFYLRDSVRRLLYIDEEGTYYDITINIDGKNKTGKVSPCVATGKDLNNLEKIADLEGNVTPYDLWVDQTFGPINLYANTAFYSAKNLDGIPDIANCTKGQKKELFSKLIGIDYYQNMCEQARKKSKELKDQIKELKAKLLDDVTLADIASIKREIDNKDVLLQNSIAAEESVQKQLDDVNRQIAELDNSDKVSLYEEQLSMKKKYISDLQNITSRAKKYLENKDVIELHISLEKEVDTASEEYGKWLEEEYKPAAKIASEIEDLIRDFNVKITLAENEYNFMKKNLVTEIDDTCPTCHQKLPLDKINELKAELEAKKAELKQKEDKIKEFKIQKAEQEEKFNNSGISEYYAKDEELHAQLTDLNNRFNKCRLEIAGKSLDIAALKSAYDQYVTDTPENWDNNIREVQASCSALEAKIQALRKTDVTDLRIRQSDLERQVKQFDKEQKQYSEDKGNLSAKLEMKQIVYESNKEKNRQITELTKEQSEYDILEKAFSYNGIPALELEAMAPDMQTLVNDILAESPVSKFKVSFQTLRQGGAGQLIEEFNILVENTVTGRIRPLEWMSGGETVWIKEALYNAFSVMRSRNTNVAFLTKFMDESDGTLTPESRLDYLKMIKKIHSESDTKQTVLITHSESLREVITSKIEW